MKSEKIIGTICGLLALIPALARAENMPATVDCHAYRCVIPYDSEGRQNGLETCYEDADKKEKLKEVWWKEGVREGAARCFQNGKVVKEATYSHGKLNGLKIEQAGTTGTLMVERVENGFFDGFRFSADASGKVTGIARCVKEGRMLPVDSGACDTDDYGKYTVALKEYRQGIADAAARQMNGVQELRYASGKIRAVYTNVNGKRHGLEKFYSQNGVLLSQTNYNAGKRDGEALLYNEEGRLKKKGVFNMGEVVAIEEYYDNQKVSRSVKRTDKMHSCETRFFDNGSKALERCVIGGLPDDYTAATDGPYAEWSRAGLPVQNGTYARGQRTGKWDFYSDSGKLSSSKFYTSDKVTKSIEYKGSSAIVKEFFPDGSIKSEKEVSAHSVESV